MLLLSYAGNILRVSGALIDPNTSAICMITVQSFATYIASFLVDRLCRRVLMIASSLGTGLGMFMMATHSYLNY